MKRTLSLLVLGIAIVLTACTNGPTTAATVNGERVSQSDVQRGVKAFAASKLFRDSFNAQLSASPDSVKMSADSSTSPAAFARQWLTSLMQASAIEQLAAKRGVKVTAADEQQVRSELSQSQSASTLASLPTWLQDEIVHTTALQLALRQSLPQATVSSKELRAAYDQLVADCASKRLVGHILVGTEQEAKDIVSRIQKGDSFANVAAQVSTDTGSKGQGGLLMCDQSSQWSQLDQTFRSAAEATPTGKLSAPVQTQFGWHVIEVVDLTPQNAEPLLLAQAQANRTDPLTTEILKFLGKAKLWVNPRYGVVERSANGAFQILAPTVTPKSRPASTPSTTTPAGAPGASGAGTPSGASSGSSTTTPTTTP